MHNDNLNTVITDIFKGFPLKTRIIQELSSNYCSYPIDNLVLKELNILDKSSFLKIIDLFPPGPIAIINEGFLMYLDIEQKRTLCKNIHEILSRVDGYWITADIYKKKDEHSAFNIDIFDSQAKEFLNASFKREIVAGRNINLQAQTFSKEGLGSPTALRDMYRDITGNPRTPHTLFDELTAKFSYDSMRMVIRFLLHSLGADLKSKGPSITRPELMRLMEETQILQAIRSFQIF